MAALLKAVLSASEKAAEIARLCRDAEPLFRLLVAEKTGADRNQRFSHDFKTLADVLIQEVIRHDLGAKVRAGWVGGWGGVGGSPTLGVFALRAVPKFGDVGAPLSAAAPAVP